MLEGKRIAYICADPGVPVYGQKGCSVHVQEIVREFGRQGASVDLICQRKGGEKPAGFNHVTLHRLPKVKHKSGANREQQLIEANHFIRDLLGKLPEPDLVYERYSLWSRDALSWAKSNGIHSFLEVNAPLIEEQKKHRELYNVNEAREIEQSAFHFASTLIAVSNEVANYIHTVVNDKNVLVLPNGVRVERFNHGKALRAEDTFTVGFVGTLKPWHGVNTLIESIKLIHEKIPELRLLLVGDGPERASLEEDVCDANLDNIVEFTGLVDPSDIPENLSKMDVAVAPYPVLEGFYFSPLKVYEYMAAFVPVIASNIGQLAGLIKDYENGLLIQPGNAEDLADKIIELYQSSALRTSIANSAYELILEQHTWKAVVDSLLNQFEEPMPDGMNSVHAQ